MLRRRQTETIPFRNEGHGYDVFGLDPRVVRGVSRALAPLYDIYFRVESHGAHRIPASGPAILVCNHSGALPLDGAMLYLDVLRHTCPVRVPRPVADRFVPLLPFASTLLSRAGVVTGTRANVKRLLLRGELLVIWPEGTTGVGKPFRARYQLQDWRVGHAEMAVRFGVPIIPVAIIGAEESWPIVGRLESLHPFGAPYLPVPASPVPLPVRYHIHYGDPLALHDELPPGAADDPALVDEAAARVRRALEQLIARGLEQRGRRFS